MNKFQLYLSFRLSERSERTEKSTFNKLSPFRKGSCSNVVGFMNSLSFRLSERSERTETKKSFPRGKLGPRSSAGQLGVIVGDCQELLGRKNPTYPDESGITASPQGGTFVTTKLSPFFAKGVGYFPPPFFIPLHTTTKIVLFNRWQKNLHFYLLLGKFLL